MLGIVAANVNDVIGNDGRTPWHYPEDLQWFKMKTMDSTVVVGRKTFETMPDLGPRREVICVSRKTETTVQSVLERCADLKHPIFIAGGASIYEQFMPYIHTFFLTRIIQSEPTDGDTKLPESFYKYFECHKDMEADLSSNCQVWRYVRKHEDNLFHQNNINNQMESWDQYGMGLAFYVAAKSKDKSSKIGAVILDEDNIPMGLGFNGMPRGVDDAVPERHERPTKYAFFEHGERNAIYNSNGNIKGCRMYVTSMPCPDCARAIIQKRLKEVIVHPSYKMMSTPTWEASWNISRKMFEESGVILREYEDKPLVTRIIGFGGGKAFCPNNWRQE